MSAAFLLAVALVAAPSGGNSISLQERAPLLLLVDTPSGRSNARLGGSEIIRLVTDLLREHTNLYPQLTDPRVITRCKSKLSCMIDELRGDFDHYLMFEEHGELRDYDQHLRKLALQQRVRSRYLLWLIDYPQADRPDKVSAYLIDTDKGLEVLHNASREGKDWRDRAEPEVRAAAIVAGPIREEIDGEAALEGHIRNLLGNAFRPALEASFNWDPYGELLIISPYERASILLDGVLVGATAPGLTRLTGVTQGVRELAVEPRNAPRFEQTIEILKLHQVTVRIGGPAPPPVQQQQPQPRSKGVPTWLRVTMIGVGVGTTAGGAVALGSAVDMVGRHPEIPVGAALITTGLTMGLAGSLLDEESHMMLASVGGIVAGVLVAMLVGASTH
jgi:hypothetical protein